MDDQEKIRAAITMLKQLKRMVGFFMKRDISELIEQLESSGRFQAEERLEVGSGRSEVPVEVVRVDSFSAISAKNSARSAVK